jgi:hypothetical protein
MDSRYEHFKDFSAGPLGFAEKRKIWIEISDLSEDEFDAMQAANKARQDRVPKVGDMAPDFEIERLNRDRKRSGEFVKLSSLRGRSVALAFGSYT